MTYIFVELAVMDGGGGGGGGGWGDGDGLTSQTLTVRQRRLLHADNGSDWH